MCTIKFSLRLLLLAWCAAVFIGSLKGQSHNSYEDELEELLRPEDNANNNTVSVKKTVDTTSRDAFNSSLNKTATSCGYEMECVEIWKCKNSTRNENGMYILQFRGLYVKEECNYNQICCHISDKIKMPLEPETNGKMQDCGVRNVNGVRLTLEGNTENHFEANFGEFPWMIAILKVEWSPIANMLLYIGGGSLLAPNVVLTAAHKVANKMASDLVVRAGEWDRAITQEIYNHQDLDVQQIISHAEFTGMKNNIALLVLKENFHASPHISPICLPSSNVNFDHSRCIVTGWGKEAASQEYPHILKKISLPVLPRAECNSKFRLKFNNPSFSLEQGSICAGGEKNEDACFGDGGAPLVCPIMDKPSRYYQAGIVTWGIGCGKKNVPGAYTNVAYFNNWITQELSKLNIKSQYYTA